MPSPIHIYSTFGSFSVKLKIVNSDGCVDTKTQQVSVNPKPVADFSVSTTRCSNFPISFTDNSSITNGFSNYITTWVWDFGDGSTPVTIKRPSSPNIKHTFTSGLDMYVVRLTVITVSGCASYKEMYLAVNNAGFNGTYGPYCIFDYRVTMSVTPSGGTFSGLGVQGNTFSPSDAGIGIHQITYTSPSGSCPVAPLNVTVVSVPLVQTTTQLVKSCSDTTDLTLPVVTTGSTPGLYYTYYTDASASTPLVNPKAVVPGIYYIKGSTMSGKCSSIKPVTVTSSDLSLIHISEPTRPY